jgi:hypothetical protein
MFSLCLIKHHATKMYGGVELQLQAFLISNYMELRGQF